ncbi:Protein RecA [bacterium HR34]|nr:Protein RecA [bacterium HR34]
MAKQKKDKENDKDEKSNGKSKLSDILTNLRKKFGESAIMTLKEVRPVNVDVISTGSFSLDIALGVGGLPRGRIIEIFGPESSGKTTVALHAIAEAQKKGGVAAFIDAEHALDPDYAKKIGVDIENLLISQPESGEQALQIVESLIRSGEVDIIVVDSVAALAPKVEIAGEVGDQFIGLQARLMSQALRKLAGLISETRTIVIFLNQTRMKIGQLIGNPETTPGGLALKFYSSVRIDLRRIAQIKQGDNIIGGKHKAKIVKNKVAPPFKTAEFYIYYNEGIAYEADVIETALRYGVLKKSGSFIEYNGKKIGQGMEQSRKALKENKELLEEIKKACLEKARE